FASLVTLFLVPSTYLILEDVLGRFRREERETVSPQRVRARDEAA
ncbi:MAG: hypothetical protein HKP30_12980, partial [Myxococcales bacterium]|nr:hypothetical protein [Myxococcales bacterium]